MTVVCVYRVLFVKSETHIGELINYVVHSLAPTMEPIADLCASGVVDRFDVDWEA